MKFLKIKVKILIKKEKKNVKRKGRQKKCGL
jgi:hypothetical protein